jgi:hypothetical protein
VSPGPDWAWWVVRDDGDRVAGPFDTQAKAQRLIDIDLFDKSEYLVDCQYAVLDPRPVSPTEETNPS